MEIAPICKLIAQAAYKHEQNAVSISFMATTAVFSKKLDKLDCSFMYTRIIKEILLTIKFEKQHIKEFVDYYSDVSTENGGMVTMINEFERTYYGRIPIWWYMCECFSYLMLNLAL